MDLGKPDVLSFMEAAKKDTQERISKRAGTNCFEFDLRRLVDGNHGSSTHVKTDLACALCCAGRRRYQHEEETPEWFTGGPTSQNETIELRGFEREGEKTQKNRREREEEEEEAAEVDVNEFPEAEKAPPAAVNEAGDAKENANGVSVCSVKFCKLHCLKPYTFVYFLLACLIIILEWRAI